MHPPISPCTLEQYLAAAETWELKHELVNGTLYAMAGGSARHAAVAVNATVALAVRLDGGPCRVANSDQRLHVEATDALLYPDAMVVCGPYAMSPTDRHAVVNPVLIVEVLSPSTSDCDQGAKFGHYRRIPSLSHYLMIDPDTRRVVHARRDGDGWRLHDLTDGEIELAAIGVSLPIERLFANLEQIPPDA